MSYTNIMLDKNSKQVMDTLLQMCGEDGVYKILEISEIQNALKQRVDVENLGHVMKFLKSLEFIEIKYQDESVYCVAILPKGRIYLERGIPKACTECQKEAATGATSKNAQLWWAFWGGFFGALAGAFLVLLFS